MPWYQCRQSCAGKDVQEEAVQEVHRTTRALRSGSPGEGSKSTRKDQENRADNKQADTKTCAKEPCKNRRAVGLYTAREFMQTLTPILRLGLFGVVHYLRQALRQRLNSSRIDWRKQKFNPAGGLDEGRCGVQATEPNNRAAETPKASKESDAEKTDGL